MWGNSTFSHLANNKLIHSLTTNNAIYLDLLMLISTSTILFINSIIQKNIGLFTGCQKYSTITIFFKVSIAIRDYSN